MQNVIDPAVGGWTQPASGAQRALRAPRLWHRLLPFALCLVALLAYAGQQGVLRQLEREGIETKAMGRETPQDFGVPFESLSLPVNGRVLQARVVRSASPSDRAILIFHGNGEAISDWSLAQARLQAAGVSSMVFDYSGFGDSTGQATVDHLREDAYRAYQAFLAALPQASARYVMGHSLGNAVMLDAVAGLQPSPAGIIVHAGFTSARDMAVQEGLVPPWMSRLLPDPWDNEARMAQKGPAILVLHSDRDEVISPAMGARLAKAAGHRASFVLLSGPRHDSVYQDFPSLIWQPILAFMQPSL